MRSFNESDFITMPWKNGGGSTLELIALKDENNEIMFRLSSAEVSASGPFSIFPQIDRILFLVKGNGLKLKMPNKSLILDQTLAPIYFAGEDEIYCELLDGSCQDFNVMTNRNFGKSTLCLRRLTSNEEIKVSSSFSFIYIPQKKILYQLQKNEIFSAPEELSIYQIDLDVF